MQRLKYEIKFTFIKEKYKKYSCVNGIYLFIRWLIIRENKGISN